MSSVKQNLKAAKAALDAGDFEEAISQARQVLESDPENYFGHVFLGRASEKAGKADDSIRAYDSATRIKPLDELAWKGLCGVYESQGPKAVERYIAAALGLAQVYAEQSDLDQCHEIINKAVGFAKAQGTRSNYKHALKTLLLPSSPIYDFLEGRLQHPALTFTRIAEITEVEERERINKDIGERRTRLGAKVSQVTTEVTREVLSKSELEEVYQQIIEWSNDDEVRREYEEKLLKRAYDTMIVLLPDTKPTKRKQVIQLAHDMVIIKHPYRLAWDIELEWADCDDLESLEQDILSLYVSFFPETGVARAIQAYRGYRLEEQTDEKPKEKDDNIEDNEAQHSEEKVKDPELKTIALNTEDRLVLASEAIEESKSSAFTFRLISSYYLALEEYESCAEVSRRGLQLISNEAQKSGLRLEHNSDAVKTNLATSLVFYQAPKNHPEARDIFDDVLKRNPHSTAALLGIGLVYEEQENYDEAASFLEKALQRDPANVRIGAEAAWCRALNGQLEVGLEQLHGYLEQLVSTKGASLELKASTSYRVGKCLWDLKTDKSSRKDRKGAYSYFIAALKANPSLAPAYTHLGLYYADYSRDKKRAKQCFQKAFELSSGEVLAAERLARAFADDAEWDIVQLIAQRVIDSGVVKPAPGSKKKGISWPFAALGVVQMNNQDYPDAVISFQSALRIKADEYNSWVGLGESYHSSGRYNAARRVLEHAQSLQAHTKDDTYAWFAEYMLANVHRELGEYDEAVQRYQNGLAQRPREFGILIALLQTFIERAEHGLSVGFYGQAAEDARRALDMAAAADPRFQEAFNFWKAVGDACMIFSYVPNLVHRLPVRALGSLLTAKEVAEDEVLSQVDPTTPCEVTTEDTAPTIELALSGGIISHRRAIAVSVHDVHAQAVGWYNLGWTQYRTFSILASLKMPKIAKYAKTSLRALKRAIELEVGNADFWGALGVAATRLNPKVAQHAFVRSLHLNERSARSWTDLGVFYLLQNDHDLAHQAFARAQATDPDYAMAWLGEGLIALLIGDFREATSHFTHAVGITDAAPAIIKSQYLTSVFDQIVRTSSAQADIVELVEPLFTAQQLQAQTLHASAFRHLLALLLERVGDYQAAVEHLEKVCEQAEARYEESESPQLLAEFVKAKADLARNQLAISEFEAAVENATTALDLSEDADSVALEEAQRRKCRMSAHMTAGLAYHNLGNKDDAISMFRDALQESDGAPDIVCVLAQMLWARGGGNEQQVAKDQLFDCIEKHAGHVGATTLLGAMAFIQADDDTLDAVSEDLQALRVSDAISVDDRAKVERLLSRLGAGMQSVNKNAQYAEMQQAIMLSPSQPQGWADLANASGDSGVAEVAAQVAAGSVPPRGHIDAESLAEAYAGTGLAEDAQLAIFLCPWSPDGWLSLHRCLKS